VLEGEIQAANLPCQAARLRPCGSQVRPCGIDRGLGNVDLNVVRLGIELYEYVTFPHPVVVVHQDLGDLAGYAWRHESHVAIDVRVIGAHGVQRRIHPRDQEVSADRQNSNGARRQQQPLSPAVRSWPGYG